MMTRIPRSAPWIALVIVIGAGGWYITQLRGEIRRLKTASAAPAAEPQPQAEPQPSATPAADTGPWHLSDSERAAMLFQLGGDGTSSANPVWFVTDSSNMEAVSMQRSLRRVFEEAGWQVRGNKPATFPLKAGIYFLSAEEQPPPFVDQALGAFESAGIPVTAGRGYRAFYTEMKQKNQTWRGFDLAADQDYVVVVGRRPPATPSDQPPPDPAPSPQPE